MLSNYVLTLIFALIGTTFARTSSTGKISSGGTDSSSANQANPEVSNQGYQFNQGVQPYSYGYNTGIRPYSYSYTYPQNGGKPQITYQGAQPQPIAQPQGMMMPMQPAYYGQNGYPMQPMQMYGYPPMQPVQFQPMQMNGPQPTIPPMPDLPSLGGDFDLTNLGAPTPNNANSNSNSANNQRAAPNPLSDFGLDSLGGATNGANSNNNGANNGLQTPDLNAELANLADPSSASGSANANNNNNANGAGLPSGVPQGLGDFGIEGLGSSPTSNSNNNNNNNNNNNPMTGLPDILSQFGGTGGQNGAQNDFADLTNLANLANGNPAPAQATNNNSPAGDFNFGGSNNNLDFDINNLPSASNLDFDLNIPSPSEVKPQKVKLDKEIATTKSKKQSIKNDKKDNNTDKVGKKLIKNRRRRSIAIDRLSNEPEVAESLQNQDDLAIDPESPRGMLNINPTYQNPYQGVYSQYPAYRLM